MARYRGRRTERGPRLIGTTPKGEARNVRSIYGTRRATLPVLPSPYPPPTGTPHSLQNLEFGGSSVPQDPHDSPVAITAR